MRRSETASDHAEAGDHQIEAVCRSLAALTATLKQAPAAATERALERLAAAADLCPDAVLVCTAGAEIRRVNSAAAQLTGYTTRQLQTLTLWDLTHSSSASHFDLLWKEFLRAGRQRGVYTLRDRNGDAVEVAYCAEAAVLDEYNVSVLRKTAP